MGRCDGDVVGWGVAVMGAVGGGVVAVAGVDIEGLEFECAPDYDS